VKRNAQALHPKPASQHVVFEPRDLLRRGQVGCPSRSCSTIQAAAKPYAPSLCQHRFHPTSVIGWLTPAKPCISPIPTEEPIAASRLEVIIALGRGSANHLYLPSVQPAARMPRGPAARLHARSAGTPSRQLSRRRGRSGSHDIVELCVAKTTDAFFRRISSAIP